MVIYNVYIRKRKEHSNRTKEDIALQVNRSCRMGGSSVPRTCVPARLPAYIVITRLLIIKNGAQ